MTFDGTSGENCLARRDRSNTPLQALTLLNDEMFLELARAAGEEVHLQKKDPVLTLFRRFLTRPPSPEETKALQAYLDQQIERLKKGELKPGEIAADKKATPELAGKSSSRPGHHEPRRSHHQAMNVPPLLHRTRRHFFQDCGIGVGKIALASLLAKESFGATGKPDFMRFPIKAKRVIYLFMAGAPSQLELFDNKPKLKEMEGKPIPPSVIKGQRYAFIQPDAAVLGPRFPFAKHGDSGAELTDRLPYLSKVADDLTFVKSMHTDHFNHAPAQLFMTTGSGIPGRASMGSWLSYGIGSEADDLPGFVVMRSGGNLSGGSAMWGSGFLPSEHQGVPFREGADPILHVTNPKGIDRTAQRQTLDLLKKLNRGTHQKMGDPEINARIEAYEMAYRMQARAPRIDGFLQGEPGDSRSLRREEREIRFRKQLFAGPPPSRAGYAIHPALPQRLGCSLQRRGQRQEERQAS